MSQRVEVPPTAAAFAAIACTCALVLSGCRGPASSSEAHVPVSIADRSTHPLLYPPVKRGDHVDTYHGTTIADPYRGFESLDSEETRQFVAAENAVSRPYFDSLAGREKIKALMTKLWNQERYTLPVEEGGRYFYTRNDGLQNQSVVYVAEKLDAQPRVLLDPNTFSEDGTVILADWSVSPDGRFFAYATSDGGTDWKTWRVLEVATGRDLGDEIKHVKVTNPSWLPDSTGFYYSSFPSNPGGKDNDSNATVHLHRLGKPQSADEKIYAIPDHPIRIPYATITEDGRYLIIDVFGGFTVNAIYYFDLKKKLSEPVRLFDDWKARYKFRGNRGSELIFETTQDAANGRVIAVNIGATGKPAIREIVPEAAEALIRTSYVGGEIFAQYLKDAHARVRRFDLTGRALGEVKLPGSGGVRGFDGHFDSTETFFSYTDALTPGSIYRYEIGSGRQQVFRAAKLPLDTSRYLTEQVFYQSKDGTRVPMFITRRRGLKFDGTNPVTLAGYGGFNIAMTPTYGTQTAAWLELGGVFVMTNLRGGSEYGETWHEAGTKLKKQNVFDDFIAAAEYLIAKGYTSPPHLAITGGSNGGLLVGATLTQRPDLFGAALPSAGVLDMLRYHTASATAYQWSSDYGLSEVADEFKALRAYSPYHNTRDGTCYPPTLVSTGDHDDRVVPWHSYKFAAALQHAQGCANPVLLTIETRAGHGAAPTWMQIEQAVDRYAFLAKHLGMKL